MPAYFAGTINALKKGATRMTADAAIWKIEGWEEALEDVEVPGTKGIIRDLQSLKKQLSREEPDGDRVRHLMAKLADSAMSIADRLDDRTADKIRDLGDALENASEEEDEEEYSSSLSRGRSRYEDDEDDDRREPSGRVKDPEHDRRLRGQESERRMSLDAQDILGRAKCRTRNMTAA